MDPKEFNHLDARPKIAAVILNWNGWQDTKKCVESLRQSLLPISFIIIVDNGSSDNSVDKLLDNFGHQTANDAFLTKPVSILGKPFIIHESPGCPKIALISSPENYGVGGGRNIGFERALQDKDLNLFFSIDNDATITPQSLGAGLKTMMESHAGLVGCLIKNYDGSIQFAGLNFLDNMFYWDFLLKRSLYQKQNPYWDADLIAGGAFLATRSALEKLKQHDGFIMDDKFFLYAEDQDFSLRMRRAGQRSVLARDGIVFHRISKGGATSATAQYYSCRNRLFLAFQYMPVFARILFLSYYPFFRIARAILFCIKGSVPSAIAQLQGLWDGFLGIRGKKNFAK